LTNKSVFDNRIRIIFAHCKEFDAGNLFQNRFKSILCRENPYLKQLVGNRHLNPLRAGIVADLKELSNYPYSGHSAIMGKRIRDFQDVDYVLRLFGDKVVHNCLSTDGV